MVRVDGVADFKAILPVDFASADGLRRSAEDCEALVLYLTEHLERAREDADRSRLRAACAGAAGKTTRP